MPLGLQRKVNKHGVVVRYRARLMVSSGREGSLSSGPSRGEDLCPSTPWLFIEGRKPGEEILELSKAIYGLKQASACFLDCDE